jgi:2-polyprenyl-3-methyl-5-hydroxy-6-metoxy-1,4-benzoquinol methylase
MLRIIGIQLTNLTRLPGSKKKSLKKKGKNMKKHEKILTIESEKNKLLASNGVQVGTEHYEFFNYVNMERWCSYYTQVEQIIKFARKRVLLIGVGDGLVIDMVKRIKPELEIYTADFDECLKPDISSDVRELSKHISEDNLFDTIVCCQVLEHIPFMYFEDALDELRKSLSDNGVCILSLPESGVPVRVKLDVPKIHINIFHKFTRIWKSDFKFNGEHYWEISSARQYSANVVRGKIRKLFTIEHEWNVRYNAYHKFFILRKNCC